MVVTKVTEDDVGDKIRCEKAKLLRQVRKKKSNNLHPGEKLLVRKYYYAGEVYVSVWVDS